MTKESRLQEYWIQIFICLKVVQNCSDKVAKDYMHLYKDDIEKFYDDGFLPNQVAYGMTMGFI